jgi:divalent metal cation (Fe/Co/Zn/Cd) transporter
MKRKDSDPLLARKHRAVYCLLAFFSGTVVLKILLGQFSGSHTLFISGLFGLFGVFLCAITMIRMRLSSDLAKNIPSDFNQEKMEFVVVASISLLIAFVTGALLFSVIHLIFFHRLHTPGLLAAWTAAAMAGGNMLVVNRLKGEIKVLKEVEESRIHFLLDKDLALSVLVVIVVVFSAMGFSIWDYLAAVLVALFIVAYSIFFLFQSFKGLMDATYDKAAVAKIAQHIRKADPSLQLGALKVNRIGQMLEIMATVKLSQGVSMKEARNIVEKIQYALKVSLDSPHEVFVGFVAK